MWRKVCSFLGHERSRTIRHNLDTEQWEGECRHCGVPMVRLKPGDWRPHDEVDQFFQNSL